MPRRVFVTTLALFLLRALPASADPLSVPLSIEEALAPDPHAGRDVFRLLPGADRAREPVSFGLPLAQKLQIRSTTALGLSGADAGQFGRQGAQPPGRVPAARAVELKEGAEEAEVAARQLPPREPLVGERRGEADE